MMRTWWQWFVLAVSLLALAAVARAGVPAPNADGLEAADEWRVEDWGDAATLTIADDAGDRGKVLEVQCPADAGKGKIALARLLEADWSKVDRVLLEVRAEGAHPVQVAIGLSTRPDWTYYEARPTLVAADRWQYDLAFPLDAPAFKTADTLWEYRVPVAARTQVAKLTILLYQAPARGVVRLDRVRVVADGVFVRELPLPTGGGAGAGAVWGDADGDGALDALVGGKGGLRLYRDIGGELVDVSRAMALEDASLGGAWADGDADGDLDLITAAGTLWLSEQGRFRRLPGALPAGRAAATAAAWLDADGDGRPDLLIADPQIGTRLWRHQGRGPEFFSDVTAAWGLATVGVGGALPLLADLDADGFPDLISGQTDDRWWHNWEGARFVRMREGGLPAPPDERGWRAAPGDFDNDGDFDLLLLAAGKGRLYRQDEKLKFVEVPVGELNANAEDAPALAAAWGDVDNDGWLDLAVGYTVGPARLWRQTGDGRFAEDTHAGLDQCDTARQAGALAFADWDADGDLDLLVNGAAPQAGVLINAAPRGARALTSLSVKVPRGTAPGTLVWLTAADGTRCGVRQLGLTAYGASALAPAHFAAPPGAYRVKVRFPDKREATQEVELVTRGKSLAITVGPP